MQLTNDTESDVTDTGFTSNNVHRPYDGCQINRTTVHCHVIARDRKLLNPQCALIRLITNGIPFSSSSVNTLTIAITTSPGEGYVNLCINTLSDTGITDEINIGPLIQINTRRKGMYGYSNDGNYRRVGE